MPLLEVKDLSISFTQYTGWKRLGHTVHVIDRMELEAEAGQIVAVVGSSGSGKSLLAHAIMGILPSNAKVSGTMRFRGERLDAWRQQSLRGKEIALVPQSITYLDPLMRVGAQVRASARGKDPLSEQRSAFRKYRLQETVEHLFPFQLSGGMARRVLVSTATVSGAKLIIADEPTPGLQEEAVKDALSRFRELADEGNAVVLITHDIGSALTVADTIAVLYAGTTVEVAPASDFEGDGSRLRHPYSRALWAALPQNGFTPIAGSQPQLGSALQGGCSFASRCSLVKDECMAARPTMRELRGGRVSCIHAT
jgi:peptide/nickel transport system ATP-binding protein